MTHTQKLWIVACTLSVALLFALAIRDARPQDYPYPPRLNPYVYGPYPEPYRGRGFERDFEDYRMPQFRYWAPPPRQTYRPAYPYQGRPYIGHFPDYDWR
jgi:hypothetical protein